MTTLTITVEFENDVDYNYMRNKILDVIEARIDEDLDDIEGKIEVDWE